MNQSLRDEKELLSKPGDTILETLEYLKMSQVELAERMGKTPSKINDIISGKEPITVNTALLLEKVLNIDAQFWLNRETIYREKLSRIEQEEALQECLDWLDAQPIKELKKQGYLKADKKGVEMTSELLQFYGVASPVQWQNIYVNEYANANFRKSNYHQTALASMAAWLRIGEIGMRRINLNPYDKELFREKLKRVKDLVVDFPEDFASQLQDLCAQAGVALVYTFSLPKAPISGVARWIAGNPLIQLTDRYKTNDHFWFTFFHEAGHILLHGKKDVFIEDFEGVELDEKKENEANQFAGKMLLPDEFIRDLASPITEIEIRKVAKKYHTHPAIVVGRLQNLNLISFSFCNNLKLKISLEYIIKEQQSTLYE